MRPRKNRPVLFEVVARTQRTRGRSPVPPPTAPSPVPGSPSDAPRVTPPTAPAVPQEVKRRWGEVRVAGGRIHFALTPLQSAVAGVGLVVLLVAVFLAGRRSVEPPGSKAQTIEDFLVGSPVPEPPPTEARPPTPGHGRNTSSVVTPLAQPGEDTTPAKPPARELAPPSPQEAESSDAFTFVRDSYYVVVQYFRLRDRPRAVAAQEFLHAKGVECTIRTGTDLQLIATERFSSEQQADALRKHIADLGKEYRESGGGYDFASAKARKF